MPTVGVVAEQFCAVEWRIVEGRVHHAAPVAAGALGSPEAERFEVVSMTHAEESGTTVAGVRGTVPSVVFVHRRGNAIRRSAERLQDGGGHATLLSEARGDRSVSPPSCRREASGHGGTAVTRTRARPAGTTAADTNGGDTQQPKHNHMQARK